MEQIGPFELHPELCVAVSGGADSMALLLLAEEWAKRRGGIVYAVTINHRLRKESTQEAKQVDVWCAARNIPHCTLEWNHSGITTGISAAARIARYELLSGWCKARGIMHLLVAHHAEDQAETVQLRALRGSQSRGLSGMSCVSYYYGLRILRPLLQLSKHALKTYLQTQGQEWIEDPSNAQPVTMRNRIRNTLNTDAHMRLLETAQQSQKARVKEEAAWVTRMVKEIVLLPEGFAQWTLPREATEKSENIHMLSAVLATIGSHAEYPRWREVERLWHALESKEKTVTLAGCIVRRKKDIVLITRENAAIGGAVVLTSHIVWDGRFTLTCGNAPSDTRVEKLGKNDFLGLEPLIPKRFLSHTPRSVFLTLPAVKDLEGVVKVPHINYERPYSVGFSVECRFTPRLPLTPAPTIWLA